MASIARLIRALPDNYETECELSGAVKRWRGVKNAADLMTLILIHLVNGASLLETSLIALSLKIGEISDVAFMKRLSKCGDWFSGICVALLGRNMESYRKPDWIADKKVVAVDASVVVEKGAAKRTYRLHFMLDIFNMAAVQFKLTEQKIGETLANFSFEKGMVVIADRIYSTVGGMVRCYEAGADFILRMRKNSFKTVDANGEKLDLLELFGTLKSGESADFKAFAINEKKVKVPVRICAMKKTPEQIAQAMKRLHSRERKRTVTPEARLFNEYFVVVTSLEESVTAEQILETYRLRWQVEIYFKRLKSILNFGELPKKNPESSLSWLTGKLMVALLMESLIATSFSPDEDFECNDFSEHLARDEAAELNCDDIID